MRLRPFRGRGSTVPRRIFWDKLVAQINSLQKIAGRNVSIYEHKGKGTVINIDRCCQGAAGACCISGICGEGYTQADCEFVGGVYQGDGTDCGPPDPCHVGACCDPDTDICTEGSNLEDCTGGGGVYLGNGSTCDGVDCGCCPVLARFSSVSFSGEVLGCTGGTVSLPEKSWTRVASGGGCDVNNFEFATDSNCLCQFQAQNCFPFTEVDYVAVDDIGNCDDPNSYAGCLLIAHISCDGTVTLEGATDGGAQCCDKFSFLSPTAPYDISSGSLDVTINCDGGDTSVQFRFIISLS